ARARLRCKTITSGGDRALASKACAQIYLPLVGRSASLLRVGAKASRVGERSKRRSIFLSESLTPHPVFFARSRSEDRPPIKSGAGSPHKGEVSSSNAIRRWSGFGFLMACMLSLFSTRAVALDPALDVNQYAHTAWRISDGFPATPIISF